MLSIHFAPAVAHLDFAFEFCQDKKEKKGKKKDKKAPIWKNVSNRYNTF